MLFCTIFKYVEYHGEYYATIAYIKETIAMTQNINNETNFEIIGLLFQYIVKRIKTQQIISILVLLTFGLGDALTAAMMMDARGIRGEANPVVSYIYANNGLMGLIAVKISFTLILLFIASLVYWRSNGRSYWMVNGFLISLVIFGVMATISNLQAALGFSFMAPSNILLMYLGTTLIFVEAGDIIDNRIVKARMPDASMKGYTW